MTESSQHATEAPRRRDPFGVRASGHTQNHIRRRKLWFAGGMLILLAALAPLLSSSTRSFAQGAVNPLDASAVFAAFDGPTTSSPISMSQDRQFIWVVNPDDGSVSVIGNLDTTPGIVRTIQNVGQEPQAVALDGIPQGRAYIASPPDNGVIVVDITNLNPFQAVVEKTLTTGAEPWNVVASHDGTRIFVANSGQDTITVINAANATIIGSVDLKNSDCNVDDQNRHFQPRGLAVTEDDTRLYVARFLSFTKPGGVQNVDGDKEGVVCQLDIDTSSTSIGDYTVAGPIRLAASDSGFSNAGVPAIAHPNQMQSIVIFNNQAYLPNIAASTAGIDRFNVSTMAYVNVIDNAGIGAPVDAPAKSINLHLGARDPEPGKKRLFFSNPWAIGFRDNGGVVNAYAVSAGSDLLVKLDVDATGGLTFTTDANTTTYIDLNDPENPATTDNNAGKNPLGIVIRDNKAFVMNYVSRNVSVVNLDSDEVEQVIQTTALPPAGSFDEQLQVGKEMFFSARGHFDRPNGLTVSTDERLSSEGWQNCGSCHFAGLTDGNIWAFGSGTRKSIPLNATWSPHNPQDQRILNYSAVFDELQDFELNIRNTSGPGPLAAAQACSDGPPATSLFDPNHGLILGDTDPNLAPCVINQFLKPNAGRPQVTVTLPGSNTAWPALDAMKEWVRFAIRTPEGALTTNQLPGDQGGLDATQVSQGRRLFFQAGCQQCHGGTKWTISNKDFVSPPDAAELVTEAPLTTTGAVQLQMFDRMLFDIGSFNLNVAGEGNTIPGQPEVGAVELNGAGLNALGFDYNGDGKGNGYNIPALLGIYALPPYYHNGACETLECVLANPTHRAAGRNNDILGDPNRQAAVVAWLQTLDADTPFPADLLIRARDIFFDPPVFFRGAQADVGANISLFGTKADLANLLEDLGQTQIAVTLEVSFGNDVQTFDLTVSPDDFNQDFGQAVISTTVDIPANPSTSQGLFEFTVDPENVFPEDNEDNNTASRQARARNLPTDRTPPVVNAVFISDDDPFLDTDAIVTETTVQVKIQAFDPDPDDAGPQTPSGLASYCIVRYRYNDILRFWEPLSCQFEPLPEEVAPDTYIVDTEISPIAGTVYAFVWVKDNNGNISRRPGFDVASFIPGEPIELNRNGVRIFRIPLGENDPPLTLSFTPEFGDVDVSVFDDWGNPNATRIDLSANNGPVCEEVFLAPQAGEPNRFQVEVRAISNSRFTISTEPCDPVTVAASATAPEGVHAAPEQPLVAGPPLRAAIEDDAPEQEGGSVFLPIVNR